MDNSTYLYDESIPLVTLWNGKNFIPNDSIIILTFGVLTFYVLANLTPLIIRYFEYQLQCEEDILYYIPSLDFEKLEEEVG